MIEQRKAALAEAYMAQHEFNDGGEDLVPIDIENGRYPELSVSDKSDHGEESTWFRVSCGI